MLVVLKNFNGTFKKFIGKLRNDPDHSDNDKHNKLQIKSIRKYNLKKFMNAKKRGPRKETK